MQNPEPANLEPWPIQQWTTAPMRLERITTLSVEPDILFVCLTDPKEMCSIFSWMHTVTVDNRNAQTPNGLGARRRCHFGNGLVLEEIIVEWQPPQRYAYRGIDETHPFGMIGYLGTIECRARGGHTCLVWRHYFNHSNPTAMLKQLSASVQMALDSLQARFSRV